MILTYEQVQELNYKQCKAAVKQLNADYDLDLPLMKMTAEQFAQVDDIANTLLYLTDRIYVYEDPRVPSMDPNSDQADRALTQSQIIKQEKQAVVKKPQTRPSRSKAHLKFRILDKEYANIYEAAKKTGIKLQTLKAYASRKADRYGYVV